MNFIAEFLTKIPNIVLLILAATSAVAGDYFAKYWSNTQKHPFYYIALITYFFSGFFYIPTLLKQGLVITSLIWTLLTIIGFVIIGLVVFKEHLTTTQIIGLILGISALIILNLK